MKLRHTLAGHDGQVLCARFGPEGRRAVTGGRDKTIAVWSLRGGKLERSLEGHERAVTTLAFTAANELVSGDAGGGLRVWSWPRGKLLLELEEHVGPVLTLGSNADGSLIASGARDETICLWSRETGELIHRYDVGPRGMSFVFAADQEHIVSGRGGDTLCFWSIETGELAWEQEAGPGTVGALELDRGGEWVVSRGWRGPITIWSASTWGYTTVLPIVEKGLGGAVLRPEHEQIVCIYEGGIGLYDAETGQLLDSFEVPSKGMFDLDVSPDGQYAITASADELGRVFEFEELEEFEEPEDEVEDDEEEDEEEEDEEEDDDDD
ncbi:WD40 repeat domain-containing protein [Enhygromyxa salina]|uniref:WD domain, G-beta repeat n=1 Tax=Enhygromyxa salina TaxID=215803 RepID=A0A2S9Y6D3_9BACT|nr:PQQ-binding-like beta-propeller repeat protein [Enhygromyxa salina]PRQ00561.1 WD domain, G-beta repeat [Enhygromyxa salina]